MKKIACFMMFLVVISGCFGIGKNNETGGKIE